MANTETNRNCTILNWKALYFYMHCQLPKHLFGTLLIRVTDTETQSWFWLPIPKPGFGRTLVTWQNFRTCDHNWTQPICNWSDLKVVVTMYVFPHKFLLLWSAFVCDVGYISIVTQYLVWASESPYQWVFPLPNCSFLTAQ